MDAIARSLRTEEIVDPLRVSSEILARKLRLQSPLDSTNNDYLPWKAAYLVIRHRFVPDASVARLWRRPPTLGGLPAKAIPSLREELSQLHVETRMEELNARASLYPGLAEYFVALVAL